uniref:Uncharacterized protein n=1 Tax=Lepeophtheirus salmonis TaxID=72036 RepID=A0A0K2TIQ2_LEPSM
MSVLSRLRSGHLHYLAGTSLYHHVTIFTKCGALDGERLGSSCISFSKIEFVCHCSLSAQFFIPRYYKICKTQKHVVLPSSSSSPSSLAV